MSGYSEHACAPEEGVVILDLRDNHVVFSDGRLESILGLAQGAFAGTAWLKLVDPAQMKALDQLLQDFAPGEGVFDYRHGDGRGWVPVRTRCFRQGDVTHICVREATMTQAEQKLSSARARISSWAPPPS